MKRTILYSSLLSLTILILGLSACVKKDFDEPPYGGDVDPNLPATHTVWDLKQVILNNNLQPIEITQDMTISGIVVADDASGNFYKTIMVQDTSSGIAVLIDKIGLSADYPVGRKVYIRCKGLALGEYGDFIQLGHDLDGAGGVTSIPTALVDNYIVKATYPNEIVPNTVTIGQINNISVSEKFLGTLVRIDSAEFVGAAVNQPWAVDPNISSATEHELQDCIGDKVIVRTSGYCNFKAELVPGGKSAALAIYTRFNNTPQLILRDPSDMPMDGDRCGGTTTQTDISNLRSMFTGSSMTLPVGLKVKGIVTSDKNKENISSKNIVLQDGTAGIVVRFTSNNTDFILGDEVEINVSGQELSEFNGVLQINSVDIGRAVETGSGSITPQVLTIAQVLAQAESLESQLVTINGCTISGPGTYGQLGTEITDGSGTMTMYTTSWALFGGDSYATGTNDITGILGEYNGDRQISIRRLSDIN